MIFLWGRLPDLLFLSLKCAVVTMFLKTEVDHEEILDFVSRNFLESMLYDAGVGRSF
jgi:hypothetical protein